MCPQVKINFTLSSGLVNNGLHEKSDEDCLYLNVYVPETETDELLPVMVWIHGGGYMTGDGTSQRYGPLYYMSHDIILVSVRYRLGPLGFMSLGTQDVPGNMGSRDQLMALHWVQDNIMSFGGDPDLVTVHGQSAGSFSSTYHIMSPLARGLFRRAILGSGPGGFSPSYHHFSEARAIKYGTLAAIELGCLKLNMEDTAECLREKSVLSILTTEYLNELSSHPSVDHDHVTEPYLPYEPEQIMSSGDYPHDIDIMIGVVEDESLIGTQILIPAPDLFGVMRELWNIVGPYAFLQKHTSEITEEDIELTTHMLNHYCGPLEELNSDKFDNLTRLATDSFFWFGVHKFLNLHTQHATGHNYYYRIKYYGEHHNIWAPGIETVPGVGHADDLYLEWDHLENEEYQLNTEDSEMSLAVTTMWSNFVKYGDPTPEGEDSVGVVWEPVTKDDIR